MLSKTNNFVFIVLKIVAWIIFFGLCIEAGALLVNFIISIVKPDTVGYLYQKLDLSKLYERSTAAFYSLYSFVMIIAVLKAILFYVVIALVTKIDLLNPFNSTVAKQIMHMSYYTLAIGLFNYVGKQIANHLFERGYATEPLLPFWDDSEPFILMAAVVYIIAVIFKRGVAIQNEIDLTV